MRKPDFVIGGDEPYLKRWWIIPRNKWFNIYLHQMLRDDDDRALHDHPWLNVSIILKGGYWETMPGRVKRRRPGQFIFRIGSDQHRLALPDGATESWSLFITGPRYREWGFHCPQGFVHWQAFTAADDKGAVGKGCDQ